MAAEHAAVDMDDVARLGRARAQALDHLRIAPGRHEADVLAVGLIGDRQPEIARELTRRLLGRSPSGKRKKASCSGVVANRK